MSVYMFFNTSAETFAALTSILQHLFSCHLNADINPRGFDFRLVSQAEKQMLQGGF